MNDLIELAVSLIFLDSRGVVRLSPSSRAECEKIISEISDETRNRYLAKIMEEQFDESRG